MLVILIQASPTIVNSYVRNLLRCCRHGNHCNGRWACHILHVYSDSQLMYTTSIIYHCQGLDIANRCAWYNEYLARKGWVIDGGIQLAHQLHADGVQDDVSLGDFRATLQAPRFSVDVISDCGEFGGREEERISTAIFERGSDEVGQHTAMQVRPMTSRVIDGSYCGFIVGKDCQRFDTLDLVDAVGVGGNTPAFSLHLLNVGWGERVCDGFVGH